MAMDGVFGSLTSWRQLWVHGQFGFTMVCVIFFWDFSF
jgi:hypothetical protein